VERLKFSVMDYKAKFNFELERPLAFFDLETTGVNVSKDRIVQIVVVKVEPIEGFTSCNVVRKNRLINPGIDIPFEAREIHGITNDMVADEPTFDKVATGLFELLKGCDLAGYNIMRFDVPLLVEEFLRAGVKGFPGEEVNFIDAFQIFVDHNPRDLTAAYKHYAGKELEKAHDASSDTLATIDILHHQIKFHDLKKTVDDLKVDVSEILDWDGKIGLNKEGEYVYKIGKDKGKSIINNPGFGHWMLGKDFTEDTKRLIREILKVPS